MLKKILLFFAILFMPVMPCVSRAAEMVNVEYIHKAINQRWDITIPYNPALSNPKVAANMKYLLTAIDVANEKINGHKTTDYGNGEYATMAAADTIATNDAVERLIGIKPEFFITTTSTTSSFSFKISAAGVFMVDWGDGTREMIKKANTTNTTYSHTYASAGTYTISIGGKATAYSTSSSTTAAISFYNNKNISAIDGSLGAIFSAVVDSTIVLVKGRTPIFYQTFDGCSNMKGEIPENLFAGVSGAAYAMFWGTFSSCSSLTSIPENLFGDISGTLGKSMFYGMFRNCTKLSGPSARINGKYLYNIWPYATSNEVGSCYSGATGLADYANIPPVWK